ncbi:hypothetical protein Bca4012_053503 [Brassica carinata]
MVTQVALSQKNESDRYRSSHAPIRSDPTRSFLSLLLLLVGQTSSDSRGKAFHILYQKLRFLPSLNSVHLLGRIERVEDCTI